MTSSLTSKPTRVSSSLIKCLIHSALCHIEAKTFVNYHSVYVLKAAQINVLSGQTPEGLVEISTNRYQNLNIQSGRKLTYYHKTRCNKAACDTGFKLMNDLRKSGDIGDNKHSRITHFD